LPTHGFPPGHPFGGSPGGAPRGAQGFKVWAKVLDSPRGISPRVVNPGFSWSSPFKPGGDIPKGPISPHNGKVFGERFGFRGGIGNPPFLKWPFKPL